MSFEFIRKWKIKYILFVLITFFSASHFTNSAQASDTLYAAIREGRAVAMMRHAIAPGGGDPSDFRIDDCSTQRNLSQEGREQARRIGEAFRNNGIDKARILSSQWCRCVDTAELLMLGEVEELPALNSFFEARENGPEQTRALREFLLANTSPERNLELPLSELPPSELPLVLVTHQVNITALTGVFPQSGEVVVFSLAEDGKVEVLGSLPLQ